MSATNTFMHPGQGKPVKNMESGPVSNGNGGLKTSIKMKNAGIKMANVKNVTLDKASSAGDKVNNLF